MKTSVRVAVIGGVRPQYIKIAALQWKVNQFNSMSRNKVIATYINSGQHYDDLLSAQIIDELGIHFDYTINYSTKDPVEILGFMFVKLSKLLEELKPTLDWVIVMGDTTTTFVAATVAVRQGLPVVHIEAGVRSGDITTVEEMHRRVVSHISTVHLCTSKQSIENLSKENIRENVYWTGDLSYDYVMKCANEIEYINTNIKKDYVLMTLHKPLNLNSVTTMKNLLKIMGNYTRDVMFVCHPRTKIKLKEMGITSKLGSIHLLDALPYKQMLAAIKECSFILTDSGGLQREAYYLKKRCLIRRNSLGWSIFIDNNIHRLIGNDTESLISGLEWAENSMHYAFPSINEEFIRKDSWNFAFSQLIALTQ